MITTHLRSAIRSALPGIAALIVSLGSVQTLASQAIIVGTVVEDETALPIRTVDIQLLDENGDVRVRGMSDADGSFRMEVPESGVYSILARRVGYGEVRADGIEIELTDALDVEIRLAPFAVALEPITVTARQSMTPVRIQEFRDRADFNRRAGIGRIYTRDDIDRIQPVTPQQILDGVLWGPRCRPVVLLDGLPFEGRMNMVPGEHVEGIEIYRGVTQIPPQYYRYGMCGLAMVWTRPDPPGMRPFTWLRLGVAAALVALIAVVSQ